MKNTACPTPRLLLAAALSFLVLPGCQTVNTAQRKDPIGVRDYVDDDRILTDGSLGKNAQIVSINEARLANGRLKVQAQIQNRDKKKHTIHYRFEWIDSHGMVQDSVTSSWKSINLQGGQMRSIAATATDPDVVDFRLELIERKPFNLLKNQ